MRDLRDLFQAMVASVRNRATAKGLDPDALELAFKASLVANGRSRPDLPTKAREVLAEYENEPGVREKANALVSTLAELRTRGEAARQKRLGTGERMGSISLTTHDTTLLADAVADVVVTLSDSTSDVITGMFKTDTAVAYWTPQFSTSEAPDTLLMMEELADSSRYLWEDIMFSAWLEDTTIFIPLRASREIAVAKARSNQRNACEEKEPVVPPRVVACPPCWAAGITAAITDAATGWSEYRHGTSAGLAIETTIVYSTAAGAIAYVVGSQTILEKIASAGGKIAGWLGRLWP